jgi:hypothetical protein
MPRTNLRARILTYLETGVTGDLLRSEGEIARAVGSTSEEIHEVVRDLVRRGEVFEPIPRRYLRRERRIGERRTGKERRTAPRLKTLERRTRKRRKVAATA